MKLARDEVYEYQSKLRKIAQIDGIIPIIAVDGIFGTETEAATRAFQAYQALPITGIADYATWEAVMAAYSRSLRKVMIGNSISPFPYPDYITKRGEKSDTILIIQILLSSLSVAYDDFEALDKTGIYDAKTSDAVKRFQSINRLPETGDVNKETWDLLARSYNAFSHHGDYIS